MAMHRTASNRRRSACAHAVRGKRSGVWPCRDATLATFQDRGDIQDLSYLTRITVRRNEVGSSDRLSGVGVKLRGDR